MNREIKFRGKCKPGYDYSTGDGWVIGSLLSNDEGKGIVQKEDLTFSSGSDDGISGLNDFSFIPVVPETVGQYTGLKDKKGNDIYHNDILFASIDESIGWYCVVVFIAEWGGFKLLNPEGYEKYSSFGLAGLWQKSEFPVWRLAQISSVIGNLHDNPELLKGGSNV